MTKFSIPEGWEAVIGLEMHAQLLTHSKLFCQSSTELSDTPNTHVGVIDAGMPGVLPVVNRGAVELAVRTGLALNCTVHSESVWSRKHYFYPDLPKGYQISQFDRPLCTGGQVEVSLDGQTKTVRLTRIHMEEDAGKNIHESGMTYVDLNRAGTPLVEIVTEPDIRNPWEAAAVMRKVRSILRTVGACDGNLEQGSLRCDANVSVRKTGTKQFGTKVEIKNINSFRFVERAVEVEIIRQINCLESQEPIVQETRGFDAEKDETFSMRTKEDAHDYRYFPDPDLPLLTVTPSEIDRIRKELPKLPDVLSEIFRTQYGLSQNDAEFLSQSNTLAEYFMSASRGVGGRAIREPKVVANWIMTHILREVDVDSESFQIPITTDQLAELIYLIEDGVVSGKIAKAVYDEMLHKGGRPGNIVKAKGLVQVSDESALKRALQTVIDAHQDQFQELCSGKDKLRGFFVGQVMKALGGKANPTELNRILDDTLRSKKGKI